eukprot:scaffold4487_cov273-Chaetoceros_neogracile.AAC.47
MDLLGTLWNPKKCKGLITSNSEMPLTSEGPTSSLFEENSLFGNVIRTSHRIRIVPIETSYQKTLFQQAGHTHISKCVSNHCRNAFQYGTVMLLWYQ